MKDRIVVVGAGINGLVAANYLQRQGYEVVMLERKDKVGGACELDCVNIAGKTYQFPAAATTLGFMQDFVFEESGLAQKIELMQPKHPPVAWHESLNAPCILYDDIDNLKRELKTKWKETGAVAEFMNDLETVRAFLINGYRAAEFPDIDKARSVLGAQLCQRWIEGTARKLFDHYFTSDYTKVYWAIEVTESGPVSLDSSFSAFTIPLLSSGSIFEGNWGFVKGGLYELIKALDAANQQSGVKVITDARVLSASKDGSRITYLDKKGKEQNLQCDYIFFATDPLTAADVLNERTLIKEVSKKQMVGTSGKLVLFFNKNVLWKDDTGEEDFDAAFKFVIATKNLDDFERSTRSITLPSQAFEFVSAFSPNYFEIYCESAAMRKFGIETSYDAVSVFFKDLSFGIAPDELPYVKSEAEKIILKRIENVNDFAGSVLFIPSDLKERFFFPEGNIDHIEICEGQTFNSRSFSKNADNFYQFGKHERIMYCGAGAYPAGSIAGTTGYMCVQNFERAKIEQRKREAVQEFESSI